MRGLEVTTEDGVLTLRLTRPGRMNAVDPAVVTEAARLVEGTRDQEDIRAVLVTGADGAFTSGADLSTLDLPPEELMAPAGDLISAISSVPTPVVAAVNGPAVGFGVGLACACDLVYAVDDAYFYLSFIDIGLMPDGGASWLVPAAVGRARAAEMALLGERMDARTAESSGLITRALPRDEFDPHITRILERLVTGPRAALTRTKEAIRAAERDQLRAALRLEEEGQIALLPSTDAREGIDAVQHKRHPIFGK